MVDIDTNPTMPIWPKRPTRNVDPDEKALTDERHHQQQKQKENNKGGDDDPDSFPHIDEYA